MTKYTLTGNLTEDDIPDGTTVLCVKKIFENLFYSPTVGYLVEMLQ